MSARAALSRDALARDLERAAGAGAVSPWTAPCGRELPLVAPASVDVAAEVVRRAARDGLALLPLGGGSHLGALAGERADFALTSRALAGVVAYEPGDGTVTALAGTPMAELAARVRAGGHRLSPDVPLPERATLGGVVSGGRSGVARLRFGPLRNQVLGDRAVLADGSVARSGGRLVKNVTGYDLHRLRCGARGTLGFLVEVSLRLHAWPEARLVVGAESRDLPRALAACDAARALPLPFDAVAVGGGAGEPWRVALALSGRAAALEARAPDLERLLVPLGPLTRAADDDALAELERLRDAAAGPTLSVAVLPSRLAQTAELVRGAARELGEPEPRLLLHPGVATLDAWLAPGAGADDLARELAQVLARARAAARERREPLRARFPGASAELSRELAAAAPQAPGDDLARDLGRALDPGGVFAGEGPWGGRP